MDKSKLTQGVIYGGLSSAASLSLKFMTIPILARLLSPEEFGVVAISLTLMGFFVMAIGKGGLGAAILYYENTDPGQYVHTAFWVNLFVGMLLAVLCYENSGLLADFSGVPAAKPYIEVISFLIPLLLIAQIARSLLLLKMQYKKIASVRFFSSMLAGITALAMAYSGAGAWSLVWQQVVYELVLMIGFIFAARYIPKFEFKRKRLAEIMPYAMRNTASDILAWFSTQGVILFVGSFFGVSAVGGYQVCNRLSNLPREIVGNALNQAVFSGVANTQNGLDKNRPLKVKLEHVWCDLLLVTKVNTYLLGSVYLLLAIYAESVVFLILGETFYGYWPIFRAMALTGFLGVFLSALYPVLKGIGEDKLLLKLSLLRAILTVFFVFSVALYSGELVSVAYSIVLVQLLMVLITVSILCKQVNDGFLSIIAEFKGVIRGFITLFIISRPINQIVVSYFDSIVVSALISGFIVLFTTLLFFPIMARSDWLVVKSWFKVKFS
ncbi:MAG: oligosaccharide flippase family protein [Oceanospirillaceae bacterium]|nr:oligosaccharide flippase family protein [Oceanospirillaceae bacterium]